MSVDSRPRRGRGTDLCLSLCLFTVLLFGGGAAWAEYVEVVCPASINAALGALADKTVSNTAAITGDCTEAVVVEGFTNLRLEGAAVIHRPPGSDLSALQVRESSVWIGGLTFEGSGIYGYSPALVRVSRSSVTFDGCTIQGSAPAGGLDVQGQSDVWIEGTTVSGNGTGIAAGTSAHVQISNWWGDECFIEGNITGIAASRNALVEVGLATIQNNRDAAVTASNGALVNLGAWGWGAVTITNNGSGDPNDPKYPNNPLPAVQAADGGVIWIIQPTTIEGNYGNGAHASRNGELYVCCGATPDDTRISNNAGFGFDIWIGGGLFFWGPALVEGNLRGGISVDSAEAFLNGGVLIQGNGDPTDPDSYGGLQIVDNARVNTSATVIDNNGPGVFISTGATAWFQPRAVIADNFGYGVELEAASTAVFDDGTTITGNRAFDLVCSSGSVAGAPQGMHPGIGKKKCPTWTQLRGYPAWLEALIEP